MAVEGLDTNKDGKYSREELAELAKVNVTSLKDFSYFTFPQLAGKAVKLGEPRDYWLEHKDGILTLHFMLPFATPVLAEAKGLTFGGVRPELLHRLRARQDRPSRCVSARARPRAARSRSAQPSATPREASALGEQLTAITGFGVSVAKTASVECNGP